MYENALQINSELVFYCESRSLIGHASHSPVAGQNLRFQNVFRQRENTKPAFSNSSGLKSVSERLRFRDGLVWTVGLTRIKLRF